MEQKAILHRWFGTSRYVYNTAVSSLEDKDTPKNFKGLVPVVFDELPEWHTETPRQIKVGAVQIQGHRMDTDLNGARGIFIKTVARALTVRPYLA